MAIIVPEQPTLPLGQSRAAPIDTYAPPSLQMDDGGLTSLGNALKQVGVDIGIEQAKERQRLEQEQGQQIEYYINQAAQSIGTGPVTEAQIGSLYPELVPAIRGRIAQGLGAQAAEAEIASKLDWWNQQPPEVRLDPAQSKAFFDKLNADAANTSKGNLFWGAGYTGKVKSFTTKLEEGNIEARSKYYDKIQEDALDQEAADRIAQLQKGVPPEAIQANPTATRMMGVPYEQLSTPMKFATTLVGASEKQHSYVISQFIERGTGKKIDPKAVPWCAAFVDSVLGVSGKPTRNSLAAADFLTYGKPTTEPKIGDIVVLSPQSEGRTGHVGFYAGKASDGSVMVLGGNQGNKVSIDRFASDSVRGYRKVPDINEMGNTIANGGTAKDFVRRVTTVESGGDPYATNANSSATGLAQFTEATWLEAVSKYRPDIKGSKEQILALRTNPDLAVEITARTAERNAKVLQSSGLEVNNPNLYLMHFLGTAGAKKVLTSAEQTKVEDIISPEAVAANKAVLAGKTVGEVREWAARKMGAPVEPVTAQRNAVRSLDREYAVSSSLSNVIRRDRMVETIISSAITRKDASILQAIPPEFMVPSVQNRVATATKQIEDIQYAEWNKARAMEAQQRADTTRSLIEKAIEKQSQGVDLDPYEDAKDPKTGRIDTETFQWIKTNRESIRVPEHESKSNALFIENAIMEGSLGNNFGEFAKGDPKLQEIIASGRTPSVREVQDAIDRSPNIRPAEKIALKQKVDTLMTASAHLNSPSVRSGWEGVGRLLEGYMNSPIYGTISKTFDPTLAQRAREAYDSTIKSHILASVNEGLGIPKGKAELDMIEKAQAAAKEVIQQGMDNAIPKGGEANKGGDSKKSSATAQAASEGVDVSKYDVIVQPDGSRIIRPKGKK